MQKKQRIITIFISLIFGLFPGLSHASLPVASATAPSVASSVEIKVTVQQLNTTNVSVAVASQPKVAACSAPSTDTALQGGSINLHQPADCFRVSAVSVAEAPSIHVASIQTVTTVRVIRSHAITHEGFQNGSSSQPQIPVLPVVPVVLGVLVFTLSIIYRPRALHFSKVTFHSLSLSQLQILRC